MLTNWIGLWQLFILVYGSVWEPVPSRTFLCAHLPEIVRASNVGPELVSNGEQCAKGFLAGIDSSVGRCRTVVESGAVVFKFASASVLPDDGRDVQVVHGGRALPELAHADHFLRVLVEQL